MATSRVPTSCDSIDRIEADRVGSLLVAGVREMGLPPGSRIVFCAKNSPELLASVFGCLLGGLVPFVLSSGLTAFERGEVLDELRPDLFVEDGRFADVFRFGYGRERHVLGEYFQCRPMHLTSGTSGRPKAVWSGWLNERAAEDMRADERSTWKFHSGDVHWVCSPLSHSAPMRFALHTLLAGGTVCVPERFDVDQLGPALGAGVTTTFMAPAQLQRLLNAPIPDTRGLRLLAHAGSGCAHELKRRALNVFSSQVVTEFYGSTEGQFTICRGAEWLERPGTVGRPRLGRQLRAVDGQLWCHPPPFARFEYWDDPGKTAASWNGDWFTIGDLGRIDRDGYVYLEGRRSDLIITGGVNVYPVEVERILCQADGIEDACVVGLVDPRWGHRVCAAIVGPISDTDFDNYVQDHLAPYKRPKTVVRLSHLPSTHTGKVDRTSVAETILESIR